MAASVDTRTGARAIPLDDLVQLAWSGQMRVPYFQRDFKWTRNDVIQLMDSIHRGYPVGSLLLWERAANDGKITLGALEIDAPKSDRALWVVDGQQRVTSLANVLHPDRPADPRFDLGYDLRGDEIVPLPPIDDSFIVPLPVVFDLTKVLTWFADRPETAEHRDAAFTLARSLRQFAIPAYQVVQEDVLVLQKIFDRMNNSGKRLRRAEVFSAIYAGTEREAEQRLTIERIAADVDNRHGFGRVDDDTVLQCILARRGPRVQREIRWEFDPTHQAQIVDFPNEDRDSAYEQGGEALARAVEFVISAGIPHYTVLPYRYLLVVLTRFLALHPDLEPSELRLLQRWLWRASVAGPAIDKGSTTGVTRTLCSKISRKSPTSSLTGLLAVVGEEAPSLPDARRFKTNEAASKIALCSWWSLRPRRPDTGEQYARKDITSALTDSTTAVEAVRSFFPQRFVPANRRIWAANKALMPVLDEALAVVGGMLQMRPFLVTEQDWQAVLDSHLIDPSGEQLLLANDVPGFIEQRQRAVIEQLRNFLALKCEWGFENTPPLKDLELDDLDDFDVVP